MKEDLQEKPTAAKLPGPADHLANERTFLAWIRTSIALIGFGFVMVKFALFINQMAVMMGGRAVIANPGTSARVGIGMVVLGAVVTVLSYLRYRTIEQQLNAGEYFPSKWLSLIVAICMVITCIVLVIYLLPNIN